MLARLGVDGPAAGFECMLEGVEHRWTYRGQVIPPDQRVEVQAVIRELDDDRRVLYADGILQVDGRFIYEMENFTLRWTGSSR